MVDKYGSKQFSFNVNNSQFYNNSMSLSTSNIFEAPYERKIRKNELIVEGKNNQKIIYQQSNLNIDEETIESKDLNRLYQSIDGGNNYNYRLLGNRDISEAYSTNPSKFSGNIKSDEITNLKNHNTFKNGLNTCLNNNSNYKLDYNFTSKQSNINKLNEMKNTGIKLMKDIKNDDISDEIMNSVEKENVNVNKTLFSKNIIKPVKKYKLNFNKFFKLKDSLKVNIFKFLDCFDYYTFSISSQVLYDILIGILKIQCKLISDNFNSKYKRQLYSTKPVMHVCKIKDIKGKRFHIYLVIKADIFSNKLVNKNVSIGYICKFFTDSSSHSNSFNFDVVPYSHSNSIWLMREYTSVRLNNSIVFF